MTRRADRGDPWVRLMRAMRHRTGCRLSADDVQRMSLDGAIQAAAESCETECTCGLFGAPCTYCEKMDGE